MKLPPDAFIDGRKVMEYLLRYRVESDKSEFLARGGYTVASAEKLLNDLRCQILPLDAESLGPFAFGTKYRIRGILRGPDGQELRVVTIWATLASTGQTRFVTLYPDSP